MIEGEIKCAFAKCKRAPYYPNKYCYGHYVGRKIENEKEIKAFLDKQDLRRYRNKWMDKKKIEDFVYHQKNPRSVKVVKRIKL